MLLLHVCEMAGAGSQGSMELLYPTTEVNKKSVFSKVIFLVESFPCPLSLCPPIKKGMRGHFGFG